MTKAIVFILNFIIFVILQGTIHSNVTLNKDSKFSITLDNYNNVQYIGDIYVGSNSQEMKTIFSTATGLTWLTGNTCTDCGNMTNKFDPTTSTTFRDFSDDLNFSFASGNITGSLSSDDFTMHTDSDSQYSLDNFKFLLAEEENFHFNQLKASGIIGLGLPESDSEYSNFVLELNKQGVIGTPKFGFYLSSSNQVNSKLFLGDFSMGTLLAPYFKQMAYCQVGAIYNKWSCDINRVEINKNKKDVTSRFVIDTATSYLYVPMADFKLIRKFYVDNAKTECTRNEINQLLCKCKDPSIFPDINISINNDIFTIRAKDIIDYFPSMSYQCRFELIIDMDNDDTWTLGTAALKNTLFTFDFNSRKIGFVQFNEEIRKLMMKDNLIIQEPDNTDSKIVYIFCLGFIIFLIGALMKFANNESFIPNTKSDSFDYDNVEDKRTVELIKNKFNNDEYDYDGDFKNIATKFEGSHKKQTVENNSPERIEMKELKETKEIKEV